MGDAEETDRLRERLGAAYQIVGALASATDTFDDPEVQRALDFLSDEDVEEILPWPQGNLGRARKRGVVMEAIFILTFGVGLLTAGLVLGLASEFCGNEWVWRGECPEVAE